MVNSYLAVLLEEKESKQKNGLYDYTTVSLSFNTNKLEGSTLSFSDTQQLFEKNIVSSAGHSFDDVLESKNHFKLFDFMLETIEEPFTERLIKEYHQLLKQGTTDHVRYGAGQYKSIPNIAGDQPVAEPYEVPELMKALLNDYEVNGINNLDDILSFHHRFELIHPFQDGNGRIGRLIMFRQCLTSDVTPFIVSSDRRNEYIEGLRQFENNPLVLADEIKIQQSNYQKMAQPFLNYYLKTKNNNLER